MKVSNLGLGFIKQTESFREHAYPDPYSPLGLKYKNLRWGFKPASHILATIPVADRSLDGAPWTIGYGFTSGVKLDDTISRSEADSSLSLQVLEYEQGVLANLLVAPTQSQFDAMVSLAWNIGVPRFSTSSVVKAHNRKDFSAAARAFGLFNKSRGRVSTGLTKRRALEASAYLSDSVSATPSQVDGERPLSSSNINRASVVAGGTATLATLAEVGQQVSIIRQVSDQLSGWLVPALLITVVALCGYIVYDRYCQRKDGSR